MFSSVVIAIYLGVCALIAYALARDGRHSDYRHDMSGSGEKEPVRRSVSHELEPPPEVIAHEKHASNNFEKATGIGTVVLAVVGIGALVLTMRSNRQTENAFKTAQRPYVSLGGKQGEIGELLSTTIVQGKEAMALHVYNGGQSTARHFKVYVAVVMPNANRSNLRHRHRYRASDGIILTEGETKFGLAAQAEHIEYVTDPTLLWSDAELASPDKELAIGGDIEYCDEFGAYHCQGWGAEYKPLLNKFIPSGPVELPCIIEPGDAKRIEQILRVTEPQITVEEISPCEQPDEPEYYREQAQPAPSATAAPRLTAPH